MRETEISDRSSARLSVTKGAIFEGFHGRVCPALICFSVLLGHIFSCELAAATFAVCLSAAELFVTDDVLPAVPPVLTLVFTLSRSHTPGVPAFSDYLFEGGRAVAFILLALAFSISLIRVLALRIRGGAVWHKGAYVPLLVLSLGFILNGALSGAWSAKSLLFGICEAAVYLIPSLVFSAALSGEHFGKCADYFAYLGALCALLLSCELIWLYTGPDTPVINGAAVKSMIVFGWGIWTSMGAALAVLIPACFVGVVRSKRPHLYLLAATAALLGIFATHSRGALIFGLIGYLASLFIAARKSRVRRTCRVILAAFMLFAVGFILASYRDLPRLIGELLADNGRFRLWRLGIAEFLSAPLFGVGFFGLGYPPGEGYFTGADFLPAMMHSTPVQLLSSMGLVGTLCYAFYRASTLKPLLQNPSPERLLVFFAAALMLLLSLVENYVFQFWPTLHYSLAVAVSALPTEQNENK